MKKKMIAAIVACSMAMTCMPGMAFADEAIQTGEQSTAEEEIFLEEETIPEEMTTEPEMDTELEMEAVPEMESEPEMEVEAPDMEEDAAITCMQVTPKASVTASGTSKNTATTITMASGSTVTNTFTTIKYDHWYKFTLNNTRRIRMNFSYEGPCGMAYIYTAANTNSHIFCTSGGVDRYVYLSAGIYYLKIKPSSYNDSKCTYWFNIISNDYVKDEISEPNDSIMNAASLAVDKKYNGALVNAEANLKTDADFVCYNVPKGKYKLNVKVPEALNYGASAGHKEGSIEIYAVDEYNNALTIIRDNGYDKKYVRIKSGCKGSFTVNMPKGKTYLKVVYGGLENVIGKYSIELVKMPGKTSNLKVKTAGSKALKITCKSVKTKTGYEVKYKKKGASKWTKKRFAKNSFTLKNLKKKTTYVVKVRTYRTVNGKTYYSSWTAQKTKRTK